MINRCPHCGFEPVKNQLVCPNCGKEIKENIAEKLRIDNKEVTHLEENRVEKNDNIVWSDLQEVPIGTLMESMSDENKTDENRKVQETSEQSADIEIENQGQATEQSIAFQSKDDNAAETDSSDVLDDDENHLEDEAPNPILAQYLEKHNARKLAEQQANSQEDYASIVDDEIDSINAESSETKETISEDLNVADQPTVDEKNDLSQSRQVQFDPDYLVDSDDTDLEHSGSKQPTIDEALSQISKLNSSMEPIDSSQDETEFSYYEENLPIGSNMKKWRTIAIAAALLLAVGTGFWYAHNKRDTSDEKVLEQVDQQTKQIATKIDNLFTNKKYDFIKSTVTLTQINQLSKQLANFDGQKDYKKLKARLATAKEQLLSEQDINAYFTKAILANGKINENVHIDYTKKFDLQLRKGQTAFDQLANLAIKQGQDEYKDYSSAKSAVDELMAGYKNQLLASSVTREKYQQAKELVDKLFDSNQKTELLKQLQTIDQALTANEQKQVVQNTTQEQANTNAAAQSGTTTNSASTQNATSANTASVSAQGATNSQPVYASWTSEETQVLTPQTAHQVNNQPIIASRLSDLQDVNNPAWDWAPGVKEKVLQACIDRGYVVTGGYVLERVRIENGEGYYNLYSISPSAKFSASPDKPMYVVTINCKTGFYKGNGNDHTIR